MSTILQSMPDRRRRRRLLRRLGRISVLHLALLALAFIFLIPILFALSSSLKSGNEMFQVPIRWIPRNPAFSNFVRVLEKIAFLLYLRNTLIIAVARIGGLLASCSIVAYSFARLRWRGRRVLFWFVLATLMMPAEVTLVPSYLLFSHLGWINTFLPFIVPAFFANNAFAVFLLRQFFLTIPLELDEAALIDGASRFRIYWQIILPLSKPALATVGIFVLQNVWTDYLYPLIYLQRPDLYTLSLGLTQLQQQDYSSWNLIMAASLMVSLPLAIVFFVAQRYFVQGWTYTAR